MHGKTNHDIKNYRYFTAATIQIYKISFPMHSFGHDFGDSTPLARKDSRYTSPIREHINPDETHSLKQPRVVPHTTVPEASTLSTQYQLYIWGYLYAQNSRHDFERFASPECNKCGKRTTLQLTHNGRPCYRCTARHKGNFSCFADLVGCDENNPSCLCGEPSRVNSNAVGVVWYTCVTGGCDLFRYKR